MDKQLEKRLLEEDIPTIDENTLIEQTNEYLEGNITTVSNYDISQIYSQISSNQGVYRNK